MRSKESENYLGVLGFGHKEVPGNHNESSFNQQENRKSSLEKTKDKAEELYWADCLMSS